jgi:spectinomycin phosphotransferase
VEPVLRRIGEDFAIALFPYVDGKTYPFGEFDSDQERDRALALIAELHRATPVVEDTAPRETFELRHRDDLHAALDDLDREWHDGPYSEQARAILREEPQHIRDALAAYDDFARQAATAEFVITHGEPHAANVIDTPDGFVLVDWDTVKLGPRERDVARIAEDVDAAAAYGAEIDADRLLMYHLWWNLAEIAVYTAEFRRPHIDSEDTRESLKWFAHFAQLGEQYPGLLD